MLKFFLTASKYDCFGCRACEAICVHDAIVMKYDDEGFAYPKLDNLKCVGCGLCERVCPVTHCETSLNDRGGSYAAQFCDFELVKKSSSGGLFSAIAKYVLVQGGVVYGVAFDQDFRAKNIRIDKFEDLFPLMGSKYVQSDTNTSYRKVREDLRKGLLVYYTGTPCQISGLKLFLIKEYSNLITSDLICHGTPSQKIFSNTITHIESRYGGKIVEYSFRDKNIRGWSCTSSSTIKIGDDFRYLKYAKEMEAYFNAFSSGALMRWSCYKCPFAQTKRSGDLTLADFWGVREKMPEMKNMNKGVSLLLVNSDKGNEVLCKIKDSISLSEIPFEWAEATNYNLVKTTPENRLRNKIYKMFFSDYETFLRLFQGKNGTKKRLKREIEYFIRSHPYMFRFVSNFLHGIKKK